MGNDSIAANLPAEALTARVGWRGSCLHDGRAYFTTSAKNAGVRDWVGIIPEDAQAQYGHVWELDNKGQVSGHFEWPLHGGSTLLRFAINERGLTVTQDGAPLASRAFPVPVKLPDLSGLEATTCGARLAPLHAATLPGAAPSTALTWVRGRS